MALHQLLRPSINNLRVLLGQNGGKIPQIAGSFVKDGLGSGIYCREELLSLGARASRPHKTWQGRGDWLHRVGRFTRRLTLEQRLDKYAGGTPALPGGNPWLVGRFQNNISVSRRPKSRPSCRSTCTPPDLRSAGRCSVRCVAAVPPWTPPASRATACWSAWRRTIRPRSARSRAWV